MLDALHAPVPPQRGSGLKVVLPVMVDQQNSVPGDFELLGAAIFSQDGLIACRKTFGFMLRHVASSDAVVFDPHNHQLLLRDAADY